MLYIWKLLVAAIRHNFSCRWVSVSSMQTIGDSSQRQPKQLQERFWCGALLVTNFTYRQISTICQPGQGQHFTLGFGNHMFPGVPDQPLGLPDWGLNPEVVAFCHRQSESKWITRVSCCSRVSEWQSWLSILLVHCSILSCVLSLYWCEEKVLLNTFNPNHNLFLNSTKHFSFVLTKPLKQK